eukprot:Amastigsp_a508398_29.p3 type:complete len:166 gc:universal Amastigsp_a508398_29:2320-2817(+)
MQPCGRRRRVELIRIQRRAVEAPEIEVNTSDRQARERHGNSERPAEVGPGESNNAVADLTCKALQHEKASEIFISLVNAIETHRLGNALEIGDAWERGLKGRGLGRNEPSGDNKSPQPLDISRSAHSTTEPQSLEHFAEPNERAHHAQPLHLQLFVRCHHGQKVT